MILPQLLRRFLRHRDDSVFYQMQAVDAIRWLESKGVASEGVRTALDLGCGHGVFGAELLARGWKVTFADESCWLRDAYRQHSFLTINLDRDSLASLGQYDLVVCSNVLEHLAHPGRLLESAHQLMNPKGFFYMSWTNWLSPWGGHEFSPLHYLGARAGPVLYDRLTSRKRFHQPFQNLFPTYIGAVLRTIDRNPHLRLKAMAPRYYTEFPWIMRLPGIREFLAWNAALLMERRDS